MSASNVTTLPRTRKPTGAVPWPFVLLEGEEKAGKSWKLAELSTSDKVGATYWIDLSEGAGDEYGAIPGARYEIIDHDGTWRDIMMQVRAIRVLAQAAHDAGEPPVVLGIDSMTMEWAMLSDWADQRARRSERGQALLKKDPDAEVPVSPNYWNDSNARHRDLMTILMTFPGIVVATARGKWVTEIKDGKPVANSKVYKVEGQKNLAYDASVWVRMYRAQPPVIVGARSVHAGVKPGSDDPHVISADFTLEWLIFDALRCDPRRAHVRDMRPLDANVGEDTDLDEETTVAIAQFLEDVDSGDTREKVEKLWREASSNGWMEHRVGGSRVGDRLTAAVERVKAAAASKPQAVA